MNDRVSQHENWQKTLEKIACNASERALIQRWFKGTPGESLPGCTCGCGRTLSRAKRSVELPAEARFYSGIVRGVPEMDEAG
jgi:hypothetical protein